MEEVTIGMNKDQTGHACTSFTLLSTACIHPRAISRDKQYFGNVDREHRSKILTYGISTQIDVM